MDAKDEQFALASHALGATGVTLSELACGCSRIGNPHGSVSEQDAQETVAAALHVGIRYFDVAPLYANGLGEARLGHALRAIPRDSYALSTTVGRYYLPAPPDAAPQPQVLPFSPHYDYSYDGAMRSVEQSLLRLGTNRLDFEWAATLAGPLLTS
ncbi:MAG: D-threo-aldose 1-dehydrogenase [Gammaproteobacteria bacterium]|jgi:D-threo-aldose 1-dehydrogenase